MKRIYYIIIFSVIFGNFEKNEYEIKLYGFNVVKFALNPFVSSIGLMMPALISGSAIVSVVLSLPTIGPLQIRALMAQDMYLAGDILLLQSLMVIIGTIISDVLLAAIDPRIRFEDI